MNKNEMLKEYDRVHLEFFEQFSNLLIDVYKYNLETEEINESLTKWRRVHDTNKYMNFDIGNNPRECLNNFNKHAKYMQEDDVLEREFDECIECEHEYMTDDIDVISKYSKQKDKVWSKFVGSVGKIAAKYQ